jgi:hypothetical protein
VDDDSLPADLETFLQEIRDAFTAGGSPPQFFFESPPASLRIPRDLVCEWMRAAMRLWVTELRPLWQAACAPRASCGCTGNCGCQGAEPADLGCDCILLGELRLTRSGDVLTGVTLDEERRPFVVHLRMLQELMLCGPCTCSTTELSRGPARRQGPNRGQGPVRGQRSEREQRFTWRSGQLCRASGECG